MKKILRDTIAATIGLTVFLGGSAFVFFFIVMAVAVAQFFSPWTLIISIPSGIFLGALLVVGLNNGVENSDQLLHKLDKLLRVK